MGHIRTGLFCMRKNIFFQLKDFAKKSNLQGSQFFQQAMERAENNIKFVDTLTHAMQQWLNPTDPNVG